VPFLTLESFVECIQRKKTELLKLFLENFVAVKGKLSGIAAFLNLVKDSVEIVATSFEIPKHFSTLFVVMALYKQYVNCLFGNERLSFIKLSRRRGFGFNEEMLADSLELSAFGLLQTKDFVVEIQGYIAGLKKQKLFGLLVCLLYLFEIQQNSIPLVSRTQSEFVEKRIQCMMKAISDPRNEDESSSSISFRSFWQTFKKRHKRHFLKAFLAAIVEEFCLESESFECSLASLQLCLCINFRQQSFKYNSEDVFSSFAKLKELLSQESYLSLKQAWKMKSEKQAELDYDKEQICENLLCLINQASHGCFKNEGVDLRRALYESDVVARYELLMKICLGPGTFIPRPHSKE
jgi:hypothetical protein